MGLSYEGSRSDINVVCMLPLGIISYLLNRAHGNGLVCKWGMFDYATHLGCVVADVLC